MSWASRSRDGSLTGPPPSCTAVGLIAPQPKAWRAEQTEEESVEVGGQGPGPPSRRGGWPWPRTAPRFARVEPHSRVRLHDASVPVWKHHPDTNRSRCVCVCVPPVLRKQQLFTILPPSALVAHLGERMHVTGVSDEVVVLLLFVLGSLLFAGYLLLNKLRRPGGPVVSEARAARCGFASHRSRQPVDCASI